MTITTAEEFDRDWDWFAVDAAGAIGHFVTAGLRPLPKTIRANREAALRLIDYFDREAPKGGPYVVRAEVERDCGGWNTEAARRRYLESYVEMASAGLYSYDTYTSVSKTDYFLVAFPVHPLKVGQLPAEIRTLICRLELPGVFSTTPYLSEQDTLDR